MKQGQLNTYFKKLSLVPGTSNGDERGEATSCLTKGTGVYDKSKRGREFQDHWLGLYNYLRYDKKANVMYCEPCREFVTIIGYWKQDTNHLQFSVWGIDFKSNFKFR